MYRRLLPAALLLSVTGCGLDYDLSAIESLVVSSINGAEDYLASNPSDVAGSALRSCDVADTYEGIFDSVDADGNGSLDEDEANAAVSRYAMDEAQAALLGLVKFVYDLDDDGQFSEAELDMLFADFSERCEALQDDLDVSEQPGGGASADGGGRGPRSGERGDMDECRESCSGRSEGEDAGVGPVVEEFDADRDGMLDDGETAEARSTLRSRLRTGDNPHPSCGR